MTAVPESSHRPADPPRTALACALAVAAFFLAWGLLYQGFYTDNHVIDTPLYQRYGDAIEAGAVPYRDFALEYPPAALPLFVLPSLAVGVGELDAYERVFAALVAICGAVVAGAVAWTLVLLGASRQRLVLGAGLIALAPLALGSVLLKRFDLWPTALLTLGIAALLAGRYLGSFAALGLGIAAKVFPVVVLPLAVAYAWRRRGRRVALTGLGVSVAVAAACVVPFLVLSPGGVWHALTGQASRPLQVESLGAGFLLAAHQLGAGLVGVTSHGSQNVDGALADTLAVVQSIGEILVLVAIWTWFARGRATRERFLRASAAAVCTFVALGKVLSPQYLIWLAPLVALLAGRRGLIAGVLLLAAMGLTQGWFPIRYWDLSLEFEALPSWLVFARNLVLVALLAVLLWPERGLQRR